MFLSEGGRQERDPLCLGAPGSSLEGTYLRNHNVSTNLLLELRQRLMQQKSLVSTGSLLLALAEAMPNREVNGLVGSQVLALTPRGWFRASSAPGRRFQSAAIMARGSLELLCPIQ